jgi:hypothetical protein
MGAEPIGEATNERPWSVQLDGAQIDGLAHGRPTLMFLTKEAVRLAVPGVAVGTACDGCPPIPDLLARYHAAGGRYLVCPICVNAKDLQDAPLIDGATLGGTVPCGSGSATRAPPRSATERVAIPAHGRARVSNVRSVCEESSP